MKLYDPFDQACKFRGIFISRTNRFVVKCDLDGDIVDCHLPNPGRLWELLFPGTNLTLLENEKGKTAYTVAAVETEDGPILLHTHRTNDLVERLIATGEIPSLKGKKTVRREFSVGKSRFDFLLEGGARPTLLEVKSCTLFGRQGSMFPDAPSSRAKKHVEELRSLSSEGYDAAIVFVVQSDRPAWFLPDFHTDRDFADSIYRARKDLNIIALSVKWNADLTVSQSPVELPIPWGKMKKENLDSGTSLTVFQFSGYEDISQGYYVLVENVDEGLSSVVSRAPRRIKIAEPAGRLSDHGRVLAAIPIRASEKLGERIYERLYPISSGDAPLKIETDFNDRWLLRFDNSPFLSKDFVKTIVENRIDRISP